MDHRHDRFELVAGFRPFDTLAGEAGSHRRAQPGLRSAGVEPDERIAEAIELVEKNRGADGRWPLQNSHPGEAHFDLDEGANRPSRWNTLPALRVLHWAGVGG